MKTYVSKKDLGIGLTSADINALRSLEEVACSFEKGEEEYQITLSLSIEAGSNGRLINWEKKGLPFCLEDLHTVGLSVRGLNILVNSRSLDYKFNVPIEKGSISFYGPKSRYFPR